MSTNTVAFDEGYADASSESGINLNPYDMDSPEYEEYEDGFMAHINELCAEAAELDKQNGGLAHSDY
jgi:hypothetical protein